MNRTSDVPPTRADRLLEAIGMSDQAGLQLTDSMTLADYFNKTDGPASDYFAGVLDTMDTTDPDSAEYQQTIADLQAITEMNLQRGR